MNNRWHKLAVKYARARWGVGWSQLTDDMREAYVAREAVFLLLGQCDTMPQFDAGKKLVRAAMGREDNE